MSTQPRIVQTDAIPPQTINPLEAGSTNVFNSAIIKQNNQNQAQNTLAQNGGKMYKSRRIRGGSVPVIVVPRAPSYAVDKDATNANNTAISTLANNAQNGAVYDNTLNGTQADVSLISSQQSAIYKGTGGSSYRKKRASTKRGGSRTVWGCLSGGKKSRRHKKSCKCKRRKSCKLVKRHRRLSCLAKTCKML